MNLHDIASALERIGAVSSRTAKEQMLKQYENMPGFKEVLWFIFNPYIRTGIAAAKLRKMVPPVRVLISPRDFINHFKAHQTGSDADVAMAKTFIAQQQSAEARWLATAMTTKDMKIGVTETTLNKIYGKSFIPKIGIMRGEHYSDVKTKVKGPFIVTEKLDGGRRLVVKENGVVTMYTRSGHVDEGLVDIEAEAQHLPDNSVFDGELIAIGEFGNCIELRQATNAIANAKGVRHGVTFNVFDVIPLSEFKAGISREQALLRKLTLASMFGDTSASHVTEKWKIIASRAKIPFDFKFIKPVPILGVVNTEAEILEIAQPIWDNGFEGVMLNTVDGHYEVSASPRRQLLKVKATEEFKLKCIGVYEGEGQAVGMLGGIILDYEGFKVRCGSGFNHPQRHMYWKNPELIVGKWIEGDSFGESKNLQGGLSLNCPIFKRVVGDA